MQHIMCNTKSTHLLLKDFAYEQLFMRLVLMRFRCCATHPPFAVRGAPSGMPWNPPTPVNYPS
jgi:hypothetical protein